MNRQNRQGIADAAGTSFDPRYLAAKKSIDDRALNQHVWEKLHTALRQIRSHDRIQRSKGDEPLRILEVGAGIGTMLSRIVDLNLLPGTATYLATDNDPRQQQAARTHLTHWSQKRDHSLSWSGRHHGRLRTVDNEISLTLEQVSIEELAKQAHPDGPFHLLLAHAVLDLVDVAAILPHLVTQLASNGMLYCTCNFDGQTVFLPENAADEEIIKLYHVSMETRQPGASHTGRRLLRLLQYLDLEILATGSSDWNIHPTNRQYAADATFFLHAIVETVALELAQKNNPLSGLAAWADLRHRQIEAGELSFFARHLDVLARYHSSRP